MEPHDPTGEQMQQLVAAYTRQMLPLQRYAQKNTRLSPIEGRELARRIAATAAPMTGLSRSLACRAHLNDTQQRWALRVHQALVGLSRLTEPRAIEHHKPLSEDELQLIDESFRCQQAPEPV